MQRLSDDNNKVLFEIFKKDGAASIIEDLGVMILDNLDKFDDSDDVTEQDKARHKNAYVNLLDKALR